MGSREGQVVAAVTPFDFIKAVLGGIPQGMRKEMLEFRSWTRGVHLSFGHFIQGSNIIKKAMPLDCLGALWHCGPAYNVLVTSWCSMDF